MKDLKEVETRGAMRELTESECTRHLGESRFGRLAVLGDGGPMIFPVNYACSDGSIVIRTTVGAKLAAAPMTKVAFEIDEVEADGSSGWSVVVRGPAFDVTDSIDEFSNLARATPVTTWVPGDKDRVLRITIREITGRAYGLE